MADTIDLQLVGDTEMVAKLEKLEPDIRESLGRRMLEEMIFVSGYIKGEKLSGQVLNARSGHLRASVTYDTEEGEGFVEGWAGVPEGPTAGYGYVHEFGGTYHVPAHTRRSPGAKSASKLLAKLDKLGPVAGYKALSRRGYASTVEVAQHATGLVEVAAHDATYQERSYIRTSFDELQDRITTRLQEAYEQAIKEGMGD